MRSMLIAVLATTMSFTSACAQWPASRPESPLPTRLESEEDGSTHINLPPESRPASRPMFVRRTQGKAQRVAAMSRTECEGTCPTYSVEVFDDGTLEYEGRDFVRLKGRRRAILSDATMQSIVELFHDARWFELRSRYSSDIIDLPGCRLTFAWGGREKAVWHNEAGIGRPVELDVLELTFDRLVGSSRWVGKSVAGEFDRKALLSANAFVGTISELTGNGAVVKVEIPDACRFVVGGRLFLSRSRGGYLTATLRIEHTGATIAASIASVEEEAEVNVGDKVYAPRK